MTQDIPPILAALNKELKKSSKLMGQEEVKFLVHLYYSIQKQRIMANNAYKAFVKLDRPTDVVSFINSQQMVLEKQIKSLLTTYANYNEVGKWATSNKGIGPIIGAALNAYIDMDRALTAGHIISYGGYNPNKVRKKGEKLPYNAKLKQVFFKIGDSFVKSKSRDECWYGQYYTIRKIVETRNNENGLYAALAAQTLQEKAIVDKATRQIYESGMLPKGRIDLRARRRAVCLFISHWHTVASYAKYGNISRRIYAFDILGHAHFIAPPNMEMLPGLSQELKTKYNGYLSIEDAINRWMVEFDIRASDFVKARAEEPDSSVTEESDV